MNREDEIPPELQRLYDASPDTAPPSDITREHTVRELRSRGMLRDRRPPTRSGWLAAALFVLAFVSGYVTGRGSGDGPVSPARHADSTRVELDGLLAAAERVQKTSTDHALALAGLARSLPGASDAEGRTVRAIVRASLEAQAAPARLVLESGSAATPDSIVWF